VQVASGVLNQPPVAAPGSYQVNLETNGRLLTEREFERVVVKSDGTGRVVRLSDVARVELGAQDYNVSSFLNDDAAVAMVIFQQRARTRSRPPRPCRS
jgi:multidrug efflux pump subunit AcrB